MLEITTEPELRDAVRAARVRDERIGLVPTMGYLHAGHASLIEAAHRENDLVIVSIFVNPTQFGPAEDFGRYPRDLEHDRQVAGEAGAHIIFVPDESTMYPDGVEAQRVWVDPGPLADHLDGASRPDHFRAVATVVAKLFNLTGPDRAYFGQKDAQQLLVIKRMVRDLAYGIEIRAVQTVREEDGLALSSRNVYLDAEDRRRAVVLSSALGLAREEIATGERDARTVEQSMRSMIEREAPDARIDFITVADMDTLSPVTRTIERNAVIALAVYFGATRLIDNVMVRFSEGEPHFI
jgi:pantoate--beta-alanine ligase